MCKREEERKRDNNLNAYFNPNNPKTNKMPNTELIAPEQNFVISIGNFIAQTRNDEKN